MVQRDLDRTHILRVDQQGGLAGELGKSAGVADHARHPVRHRLQQRQAEALVQAWKGKRSGGLVESAERPFVDVTQVANPGLGVDAIEGVPVGPARAPRDNEGWSAPLALPKLAIGREEARVVLAWLDSADRQDEAWLEPGRQRPRLDRAADTER